MMDLKNHTERLYSSLNDTIDPFCLCGTHPNISLCVAGQICQFTLSIEHRYIYWNKRSLKFSNHLLVAICIFYRPEGDQFFTIFMVQNRGYFHNAMRSRLESVHVHVG